MTKPRIPVSTYRLQFNQAFTFRDARGLAGYLQQLGITDVYASPLLQSRRGSSHGYDVTDPTHLNVELGSEQDFEALSSELRQRDLGLVLDIVPNHMAADIENPWWADVLENGPGSAYASHFDIDWHPPARSLENKVLLPILGDTYGRVLEDRELRLLFEQGRFFIQYYDHRLPVAPKSYRRILQYRLDTLRQALGSDSAEISELSGILASLAALPERTTLPSEVAGERRLQVEGIKERLANLYGTSAEFRKFLNENVRLFNGRKGKPQSFLLLDRLLSEEAYALTFWRNGNEAINYRRFFAVSGLVGVRVEDPLVFDSIHAVTLKLVERGEVTGLRADHIDGLRDPLGYLRRLHERLASLEADGAQDSLYIVVEKILAKNEVLPAEWPIAGTTGYEFLNAVTQLFVDRRGAKTLDRVYKEFLGRTMVYEALVYEEKKQVMNTLLAVEMRALVYQLLMLAEQDRYARDLPQVELARALVETTAWLPVYRTYVRSFDLSAEDQRWIQCALEAARRRNPALNPACFDFVRDILLLRSGEHLFPEEREARLAFVMRWQQFTGPITAKGVEDSALYVYSRLISLNEVGGDPCSEGTSVEDFHRFIQERQRRWPYAMNATTTHDTKRSEDVRARINVLSEIPEEWRRRLIRWARFNRSKKITAGGRPVPDPNEEAFLYQTLLGAWPADRTELPEWRKRLKEYVVKATREAMVHTRWTVPNVPHERALIRFTESILDSRGDNPFLRDFLTFQQKVIYYGMLNSLAQVLLKITCPGVPDFYQGSELWDLRLVDPDNRRPVNFRLRMESLAAVEAKEESHLRTFAQELLEHWSNGRIKLFLIVKALNLRRSYPSLFLEGEYVPLRAEGGRNQNICAFARVLKNTWMLTVVPRLLARSGAGKSQPQGEFWKGSRLILPRAAPARWKHVFTGEELATSGRGRKPSLALQALFAGFPLALLEGVAV